MVLRDRWQTVGGAEEDRSIESMTETAIDEETGGGNTEIICVVVRCMCGHASVCVCAQLFAESSYLRVISQSPEFDTMRSTQLRRRHTLLF